jgi:hypothetical protein
MQDELHGSPAQRPVHAGAQKANSYQFPLDFSLPGVTGLLVADLFQSVLAAKLASY